MNNGENKNSEKEIASLADLEERYKERKSGRKKIILKRKVKRGNGEKEEGRKKEKGKNGMENESSDPCNKHRNLEEI